MTRLERLDKREADRRKAVAEAKKDLAETQKEKRTETTKARNKRCYQVGALAEKYGLSAEGDETLAGLFQALGPLLALPHPVAALHRLVDGGCVLEEDEVATPALRAV